MGEHPFEVVNKYRAKYQLWKWLLTGCYLLVILAIIGLGYWVTR